LDRSDSGESRVRASAFIEFLWALILPFVRVFGVSAFAPTPSRPILITADLTDVPRKLVHAEVEILSDLAPLPSLPRAQSTESGSNILDLHVCKGMEGDRMAQQTPLHFVFYIAAPADKVWEGFVSPESNRVLFMGAELEADLKPGGEMNWVGPGPDGKRVAYVHGEVLQSEPPSLLQYTFAMGPSGKPSRVTIELVPETEATRVSVIHDQWAEDDSTYGATADGWPRILSRLKTLLETGKTFKPH